MIRHIKGIKLGKKAKHITYSPDGNPCHEVREWAVHIGLTNIYDTVGAFTYSDLLRLRRVVNRAIKIVQNPKKHEINC